MKQFSIESLAQIIKAEPTKDKDIAFDGVSIDSRTIKRGDCFFAVAGENFDGHDYLNDAFDRGAVCAVVSRDVSGERIDSRRILRVDNTIEALGNFAALYRRQCRFKVVAITGSVGKTTSRHIVVSVLGSRFRCSTAPKNFNNAIGLPLTILWSQPDNEIVIVELGTNRPGEIAYLSEIAQPDIALITNVYPAHIEGFGSLEKIAKEKISIAEGLKSEGQLIINGDCSRLVDCCRSKGLEFTAFGISDSCDIRAEDIRLNGVGSRFSIDGSEIFLPLPGMGNVENALAAWSVCHQFGIDTANFAQVVKTISAVPMRSEILRIGTLTVLNDCYNANPASMKNALDILNRLDCDKKRRTVFICGGMEELGNHSSQFHAELGRAVAQCGLELLITIGSTARLVGEAAKNGTKCEFQIKSFEDIDSACNNLENFIKNYDIVLVKGSRAAGLEQVITELRGLFSGTADNNDCGC